MDFTIRIKAHAIQTLKNYLLSRQRMFPSQTQYSLLVSGETTDTARRSYAHYGIANPLALNLCGKRTHALHYFSIFFFIRFAPSQINYCDRCLHLCVLLLRQIGFFFFRFVQQESIAVCFTTSYILLHVCSEMSCTFLAFTLKHTINEQLVVSRQYEMD